MGTRFVSAKQSPIHVNYKNTIIEAEDTGTYVLNKKSTPYIRALKTERTLSIHEEGLMPKDIFARIQDLYLGGDMEASVGLAGQSASLISAQKSVADIIKDTVIGFRQITARLGALSAGDGFQPVPLFACSSINPIPVRGRRGLHECFDPPFVHVRKNIESRIKFFHRHCQFQRFGPMPCAV